MDSSSHGGYDSDDSLVANSVESERTPSPSILGGLELLDRSSKRSTSTPVSFNPEKKKKLCCQDTSDEEINQRNPPIDDSLISCCKDVGSQPFPYFRTVHQGYHHSPVFTPPRDLVTPLSVGCRDEPTTLLSSAAGGELDAPGLDEKYSQVLFSSNQSSCQSPNLSFMTTGNLSPGGEDVRDQLTASTNNIIHSLLETLEKDDGITPSQQHSDVYPVKGDSSPGKQVKTTEVPTDENAVSSSTSPGRCEVGNEMSSLCLSSPTVPCLDKTKMPNKDAIPDPIQTIDVYPMITEVLPVHKDTTETTAAEDDQLSENQISQAGGLVPDGPDPCPGESRDTTIAKGQEKQTDLCKENGNDAVAEQSHDVRQCSSNVDESNREFDCIFKEYRDVEEELTQNDNAILSTIEEKLSRLKDEMKRKANSLKEERCKILSQGLTSASPSADKIKEEGLLHLSIRQKQILSLLNIHKGLAALLTSKMSLDEAKAPPRDTVEDTSSGHNRHKNDAEEQQRTTVWSDDDTNIEDGSDNSQLDCSKTSREFKSPHPTLKDLLDEGVITPGKRCLTILGNEGEKADLLPDGSVMSGNVWFKTEREWYLQRSNKPKTTIKKPKLWKLVTYNGDLLSNFVCQYKVLSMAKTLNPIGTMSSVHLPANTAKSHTYTTVGAGKEWVSKGQSLYDSTDLSSIKLVHLIGDNELYPDEEFFRDRFWSEDEVSGSAASVSRINDLLKWED